MIQNGSASVTSGGEILSELGPGDFFGEIALLGEGVRTATVTASSPVGLIVMFGQRLPRVRTLLSGSVRRDEAGDGRSTGTLAKGGLLVTAHSQICGSGTSNERTWPPRWSSMNQMRYLPSRFTTTALNRTGFDRAEFLTCAFG